MSLTFLFIHQNFPAQYRHLARYLADQPNHEVYFVTRQNRNEMAGIRKLFYEPEPPNPGLCHGLTQEFDLAVRTGLAVMKLCRNLKQVAVRPDIIIGHSGWGETMFVKDVFPDVPLLSYFEFFYQLQGADVGFDTEFGVADAEDGARLSIRNAVNRHIFAVSDWGHTATNWQRSLYPAEMQRRITALHEGVDTDRVAPDPAAWVGLARDNRILTRDDQIITYVARNLEPYRGFHIFMRSLPEVLRRHPRAHVLIVGGDGISYGDAPAGGLSFRELLLAEVGREIDLERVHFLGQIAYDAFLNVLQVSTVHVYLTYPFVLSWSFIEALSAGCVVIGSSTPPVQEILRDGENGLEVDFFSVPSLVDRITEVLDDPDRMQPIRDAARQTAIDHFDLGRRILPQWLGLLGDLIDRVDPESAAPIDGPATRSGLR
jgi:glycosyltransferase involved in cell wall biosynthesis